MSKNICDFCTTPCGNSFCYTNQETEDNMVDYIIVKGELYRDHEHNWKTDAYGTPPFGHGEMWHNCTICKLEARVPYYFDGRHLDLKWDELEIIEDD